MALVSSTFGRLLEPGLRKTFFDSYTELAPQYSQVFKVQTSNKAIETDLRMGGFGLFGKKDSMGSVAYQEPTATQSLQYIHEEYASGFTVERKLVRDEMYNQISKMSTKLGVAARATIETIAAQVLNNAFTVNGFDGKPLISATHTALNGSTVINNSLSTSYGAANANAALTDRSLKAALIQAADQRNDAGILIQCKPRVLVVPPALEFVANTILQSSNLSQNGTGSGITNDKNTLPNFKVVVLDYISAANGGSNTQWFVIDPSIAELNFFWRDKLEFANTDDFDTMQAKYRAYMRFSVGYSDFRGIVGSTGVNAG